MSNELLSGDQLRAMPGLGDWRAMYDALEARYRTQDFTTGLEFVNRIVPPPRPWTTIPTSSSPTPT